MSYITRKKLKDVTIGIQNWRMLQFGIKDFNMKTINITFISTKEITGEIAFAIKLNNQVWLNIKSSQ